MHSPRGDSRRSRAKPLGFFSVLALIFFEVAGGPFGIEDSVRYGGASLALVCLLILPFLWSIPEALVTAELATLFPENAGYVAWVTAAFGPFWGFHEGCLSWISGVIDNSIYPLFLARYLRWFFPILDQTLPLKCFLVVSTVLMTYLNYRGLKVVGRTAVGLTLFILCPFVVLTCMGMKSVQPSNWFEVRELKGGDLEAFLNVMFWNLNYWDSISTLSGEIGDSVVVLPKALFAAVFLVVATYFVPVLVGVGIVGSQDWPDGFFSYLGKKVGGVELEGWIVLAAVASQMGLFTAELSSDAYLILGLAEKGVLPKVLGHQSRHGTPTYALLLSCLGCIIMLINFDFVSIVEMLNVVYCLTQFAQFCALVRLRITMPNLPRPFGIPLGTKQLCCALLPSTLLLALMVALPIVNMNWKILIFTGVVCCLSLGLYCYLQHARAQGYLDFSPMTLMAPQNLYAKVENDSVSVQLEPL